MVNLIVAITNNNAIGKNNELLFKIKKDLQNFKSLTTNNVVIMGRKTYESIGKPLPNRVNLIVSRSNNGKYENFFNTLEDAIEYSEKNYPDKEIFIIGGGQIYSYALDNDMVDRVYITKVNINVDDADTFFPVLNYKDKWKINDVNLYHENDFEFFMYYADRLK